MHRARVDGSRLGKAGCCCAFFFALFFIFFLLAPRSVYSYPPVSNRLAPHRATTCIFLLFLLHNFSYCLQSRWYTKRVELVECSEDWL